MADLQGTLDAARRELLLRRSVAGAFVGRLSSSALSTATAAMAFAMAKPGDHRALAGWQWLREHQNGDGGFGDTVDSPSNISTTTLCQASLGLAGRAGMLAEQGLEATLAAASRWMTRECGGRDPEADPGVLVATIRERYGADQTFSVPILTTCALSGRLGADGWGQVPQLPFELALCPHRLFGLLRLRVVSYALPALIAIGQVRHHHRPSPNPVARGLRALAKPRTLAMLQAIQPRTGGYLEAAPLTSFVAMSLSSMGLSRHPVVEHGLRFLAETVRDDGSWPIDTNLDTWTTTLAVNALAESGVRVEGDTADWLLRQQTGEEHPYTRAAAGGFAWTDRAGGVPDADDTAGAVLALRGLPGGDPAVRESACRGITWLLDLQNRDGGVPTFCRGWGKLPFDRSSSDLAAHALRAFAAWRDEVPEALRRRIDRGSRAAVDYLCREQRGDGAWVPLWFGNQHDPGQENPIYGTSRVLRAVAAVRPSGAGGERWLAAGRAGVRYLLAAQRGDGGFGTVPSIEETALAVEALAAVALAGVDAAADGVLRDAVRRGAGWLVAATEGGRRFPAVPIGLYFARLWYSEELYPLVFTVSALGLAARCLDPRPAGRKVGEP